MSKFGAFITNLIYISFMLSPVCFMSYWFLARDVIYTSRAYATMSVSVCL